MLPTATTAAEPLSIPGPATTIGPSDLIAAFYASLSPNTLAAYRRDLADFAQHISAPDVEVAARRLLTGTSGDANALALAYRSSMVDAERSSSTVNRRLSALRSLMTLARTLGLITWTIEIRNLRSESYRDTRGPQTSGVEALLAAAKRQGCVKALRDAAMVRLMFDIALRRGEVVALDLADADIAGRRVWVLGKGRREKVPLTLPEPTATALAAWIAARGGAPGPLFTSLDLTGKGAEDRRLRGQGLWTVIKALGRAAGIEVRPHGLRHSAITAGLDKTKGDLRAVQRFSRHADWRTLARYDDNRSDLGGEVASLVAAEIVDS